MAIIGFNFTKINVEKTNPVRGKININNNMRITDVEDSNLSLGKSEQKALNFIFEFNSKFEPNIGFINLVGNVTFLGESKKVEGILSEWKKSKIIQKEVRIDELAKYDGELKQTFTSSGPNLTTDGLLDTYYIE